jgi:hypothetical protein
LCSFDHFQAFLSSAANWFRGARAASAARAEPVLATGEAIGVATDSW